MLDSSRHVTESPWPCCSTCTLFLKALLLLLQWAIIFSSKNLHRVSFQIKASKTSQQQKSKKLCAFEPSVRMCKLLSLWEFGIVREWLYEQVFDSWAHQGEQGSRREVVRKLGIIRWRGSRRVGLRFWFWPVEAVLFERRFQVKDFLLVEGHQWHPARTAIETVSVKASFETGHAVHFA